MISTEMLPVNTTEATTEVAAILAPRSIQRILPLEIIHEIVESSQWSENDLYNLCLVHPFTDVAFRVLYRDIPFLWNLHKTKSLLQTLGKPVDMSKHIYLNPSRLVRTFKLDTIYEHPWDCNTQDQPTEHDPTSQMPLALLGMRGFMFTRHRAPTTEDINKALLNLRHVKHLHIYLSPQHRLRGPSRSQELFLELMFDKCLFESLESFTGTALNPSLPLIRFLKTLTSPTFSKLTLDTLDISPNFISTWTEEHSCEAILEGAFPALKSLSVTPFVPYTLLHEIVKNRPIEEISILNEFQPMSQTMDRYVTLAETLRAFVNADMNSNVKKVAVKCMVDIQFGDLQAINDAFPNVVNLTFVSSCRVMPFSVVPNRTQSPGVIPGLKQFKNLQHLVLCGVGTGLFPLFHRESLFFKRETIYTASPAIKMLFNECDNLHSLSAHIDYQPSYETFHSKLMSLEKIVSCALEPTMTEKPVFPYWAYRMY